MKAALLAAVLLTWSDFSLYAQSDIVSGLVVGSDGTSIPGISVRAIPEGPNAAELPTIVTKTDSSGQYRFERVPPGTYTFRADPDGWSGISLRASIVTLFRILSDDVNCDPGTGKCSSAISRTTIVPRLAGPARLTIPDKASTEFNIIVLPAAFAVSGHLASTAGKALPPLMARLTATMSQLSADTDVLSDGTFEISGVPPGTYILRIIPNLGIAPETITVTDHNQSGIELGGKGSGVRVSGNVAPSERSEFPDMFPQWVYLVEKGATEVSPSLQTLMLVGSAFPPSSNPAWLKPPPPVVFADESGDVIEAPFAPVGSDGRFEFLSVRKSTYYLRTVPEMGIPNFPITVGDANVIDVRAGSGVRVRGEIVSLNLGTRPPDLIRLTATGFKGQSVSAEVNANGSFEFPKVGPGTYQILLDNKIRPKPSEVTIGEEDVIFRVEAPFKASVAGRVVFSGAIPPPEILTGLRVGMNNGYDSEVKADGSFHLKSDEGEYAFFLKNLPEGCIVKSISDGTGNLMDEPVKVDLSSPSREILVTLEYTPPLPPKTN